VRTYLNVPFSEKDRARNLGARWDVATRRWYVENVENIAAFMRWMPPALVRPHRPAAGALPVQKTGKLVDREKRQVEAKIRRKRAKEAMRLERLKQRLNQQQ